MPSLILFGLAGGACARDLLLGLRLLQGAGAAALGAINITIVGDLCLQRFSERVKALSEKRAVSNQPSAISKNKKLMAKS